MPAPFGDIDFILAHVQVREGQTPLVSFPVVADEEQDYDLVPGDTFLVRGETWVFDRVRLWSTNGAGRGEKTMAKAEFYVSADVEADGPVPGPSSGRSAMPTTWRPWRSAVWTAAGWRGKGRSPRRS
ncbi:DUF6406 domain-containing protein [Streptomyces sp. NPDC001774]